MRFDRTPAELTGGRPLSPEELRILARLEGQLDGELEHELADLQHERRWRDRAAGVDQTSGPEEGGP